jgi:hypothetical protein
MKVDYIPDEWSLQRGPNGTNDAEERILTLVQSALKKALL